MRQYSSAANRWLWMSKATSFQKETPENKPQCLLNWLSGISLARTTTRRKPQIESFASQLLRIFSCFGEARGFSDMWTQARYWSPDIQISEEQTVAQSEVDKNKQGDVKCVQGPASEHLASHGSHGYTSTNIQIHTGVKANATWTAYTRGSFVALINACMAVFRLCFHTARCEIVSQLDFYI